MTATATTRTATAPTAGAADRAATGGRPSSERLVHVPRTRVSRGHVLMVVAALAAVLGNLALLGGDDATRPAVAAARDLAPGTVVADGDLTAIDVPDDPALVGLAANPSALLGLVVVDRVVEGDLVRRNDVVEPAARDAELRQLSLPIAPERAVGGDLRPDDRVDVIGSSDEGPRYLVTDVRVVAVGQPSSGLGQLTQHHVVLEVDAAGALCLAGALAGDQLDLVRSTGQATAAAEGCA